MYRGTTPTYIFETDEFDMTQATNVYVTFSDMEENMIFTKCGDDLTVTEDSISVFLDQAETLSLPDKTKIQINWLYQQGTKTKRATSEKFIINTKSNLIDQVL